MLDQDLQKDLLLTRKYLPTMAMQPTPQEKGTPEDTFKQLCSDFELEKGIYEHIMAKKMKTLRDFRFWFDDEKQHTSFVAEIRAIDDKDKQLQVSKLRQAWTAVKDYLADLQKEKASIGTAELEDMLGAADLERRKSNFWRRHKEDWANEVFPADTLISRGAREMERRALLVYDAAMVRNLLHQITTHKKKKKQAVPGADL